MIISKFNNCFNLTSMLNELLEVKNNIKVIFDEFEYSVQIVMLIIKIYYKFVNILMH